jgi:hypothetical protein
MPYGSDFNAKVPVKVKNSDAGIITHEVHLSRCFSDKLTIVGKEFNVQGLNLNVLAENLHPELAGVEFYLFNYFFGIGYKKSPVSGAFAQSTCAYSES